MKKIFTVLGIAAAAFMANAQNLLKNPGFENWDDAGKPVDWYVGSAGSIVKETAIIHSGTSSVKNVGPATSGNASITQDIAASENTDYTVSYWVLDNDANARGRHWIQARTSSGNITWNGTTFQPSTYTTDSPEWVYVTATSKTPAGTAVLRFDYRTYGQNSIGGSIYIDDVVLSQGVLATGEVSASKHRLIKNTIVDADHPLTFATKSNVQIFDMTGKMVKSAEVNADSIINVNELPKGTYIVKGLANGEMSAQKFIKK